MNIKKMDIVGRYSYHCDILFRVVDIKVVGDKKIIFRTKKRVL